MSDVYDSTGHKYTPEPTPTPPPGSGDNKGKVGLIVAIVIMSFILIGGAIFVFILYRKYINQNKIKINAKSTSMALITVHETGKLTDSKAEENDGKVES